MNIEQPVVRKTNADFLKPLLQVCKETCQPEWREFYQGCETYLNTEGYLSPKQKARMEQHLKFALLRAGLNV